MRKKWEEEEKRNQQYITQDQQSYHYHVLDLLRVEYFYAIWRKDEIVQEEGEKRDDIY